LSAPCLQCGQARNGSRHNHGDHTYEAPPKERKKPKRMGLSTKPKRVERRKAVSEARQAAHAGPRVCVAPAHGITTPCGTGMDGTLQASHVYGLGMGGGKEYGEVVLLCARHHRDLDLDRATYRAAGLSKPAPVPEKVVRRPSASEDTETPPASSQRRLG
jgi:hypothetical protein